MEPDRLFMGEPTTDDRALADEALRAAGRSAFAEADRRQLEIAAIESQVMGLMDLLTQLRREQPSWRIGAEGEQRVVQVLVDCCHAQWHVLADRARPGTRHSNIDVILVGPGGAFVIDVRTWRRPRIESGRLWHDQAPEDEAIEKLRPRWRRSSRH